MMFSFTLENPEVVRILSALQKRVGLFPLEVNANGIDLATMDDGLNTVVWVHFPLEMMKDFEFNGEGTERYIIPSEIFVKAAAATSYPLQIGSLMDGSLKLNSADGRRNYKIIPERDDKPEDSEYCRNRFATFLEEQEHINIKIRKQDLLEAVRTVEIASGQAKLTIESTALVFSAVDSTIEADAVAPLIDSVENPLWSHTYELNLLKFFLGIVKDNLNIDLYLFSDTDTFLVTVPISENGFCKMAIAAIPERGEE